jgi:trk system potassium uptake protein
MNILYRYLGYILLISAGFRIIPLIAGLIYGESIATFVITLVLSIILGISLILLAKKGQQVMGKVESLDLPKAFILVGLTFIILPLIGAISFLPSFNYNFLNAFFESISGFTTTGLTLYSSVEELPKSLLLWRAETQWIGGIGIVMVFLFIISRLHFHGREEETQVESTSALYETQGFSQSLEPSLTKSSKNVLIIYGGYTILGFIFLLISGMSIFESLGLAFTSISTGGFIVTDTLNVTNFQVIILSVLMLLGSISFITHNKLLQKKFKEFILSYEKNVLLTLLVVSVGLVAFVFTDFKTIIFQLISAFTTTGYSVVNFNLIPHLFLTLIMAGMIVGGSVASTSGGIKVARIYSLLAMIPWMLKKLVSPRHALIPFRINKKNVEEKNLFIIIVFVSLYFLTLFVGILIFLLLGYSFLESSFQIVSALGTVGLQSMDLLVIPGVGKIVLIVSMLLGRLEIFPLLILVRNLFKKSG